MQTNRSHSELEKSGRVGVGGAFVAIFRRFGARVFRNIAFGRGCLLRRVTTRGSASNALPEGQYFEPLGPQVLLGVVAANVAAPVVVVAAIVAALAPTTGCTSTSH